MRRAGSFRLHVVVVGLCLAAAFDKDVSLQCVLVMIVGYLVQ